MKIKKIVLVMMLVLLSSCTVNAKQTDLEAKLEALKKENQVLKDEIESLNNLSSEDEFDSFTFKDFVKMKVIVLDKLEGYLMVTLEDRDHNTPLLISVEEQHNLDNFVINETYDLNVYIINVIENNKTHIRYEFILGD